MGPASTPAPFLFAVAWRVVRRSGRRVSRVPDIITDARAAVCRAPGRPTINPNRMAAEWMGDYDGCTKNPNSTARKSATVSMRDLIVLAVQNSSVF